MEGFIGANADRDFLTISNLACMSCSHRQCHICLQRPSIACTQFFISASSHFESSIELLRLLRQDVGSVLICLLLKQTDAVTRLKEPGHFVAFIKITPALIPCIFSRKWKILNYKANFLSHIHWISFRFHFFYPLNCLTQPSSSWRTWIYYFRLA